MGSGRRARQNLTELEERLGTDLFKEMCGALEARARFEIDTSNFGDGHHGVQSDCPECGSDGLLIGTVDVDFDVDFDVEPLGGGQYEPVPYSITIIALVPAGFTCNVCKLELVGVDELTECGLPTARMDVTEGDLGPNFEIGRYIYDED